MNKINKITKLSHFVPIMQKLASLSKFMDVTGEFRDLLQNIENCPVTYQTEQQPLKDRVIYLHYFTSDWDWWIFEKDSHGNGSTQCFGVVRNPYGEYELGYISVDELIRIPSVSVDLYMAPTKLKDITDVELNNWVKSFDEEEV